MSDKTGGPEHAWCEQVFSRMMLTVCQNCGITLSSKSGLKPCKGPISIEPRRKKGGQVMPDEFENARERGEAYPTMDAYCQSRTPEQLAQLIYDETHRANVFGTYFGSNGLHSQSIIAAASRLSPAKSIKAWAVMDQNGV
jgi:hypothetical protein